MPRLPSRKLPVDHWPLQLSAARGRGPQDFYVLGRSGEYDEAFSATNPETYISPTSYFTHVLHFTDHVRDRAYRVSDRLLDMWWSESRQLVYAAGFPRGVFEADLEGIRELVLDDHNGTFVGLWGTGEEHLFACGFKPFVLYRRFGAWQSLELPRLKTEHLHDVHGSSENDVYFVGGHGTILHFDGHAVSVLEPPTTRNLLSIAPLGRSHYCIGGLGGILLVGNRQGWRIVQTNVEDDLYSLAPFRGQVFYGTIQGLYAFDGRMPPTLVLDMPLDSVSPLGDAVLLSHETGAWLYDGTQVIPIDTVI
jgi:hypothetical protein